jgi:hypothetical protein
MGTVTRRAIFLGAFLPPLAVIATLAAYLFGMHRGQTALNALAGSLIGGIVCLAVAVLAAPSTEDEFETRYAGEKDASNVARVRVFTIMMAPLFVILMFKGSDLQLILGLAFGCIAFMFAEGFVQGQRMLNYSVRSEAPRWILPTGILPAGLVAAFFVDSADFLPPEKIHIAAVGVLAVSLVLYISTVVIPWLPKTEGTSEPIQMFPPHA